MFVSKEKTMLFKMLTVFIGLVLFVLHFSSLTVFAESVGNAASNKLNVVVVLDASGSMNYTDANGNRFEAITQFVDLIAEKGNYVGGVVFGTDIEAVMEPKLVQSYSDKQELFELLHSIKPDNSKDTNIGAALLQATDLLNNKGDQSLSKVVVLLSDGKTDLKTDKMMEESLENKADAIEIARREGIRVFTVCLNQNGKADPEEMAQIAKATGGESKVVTSAEDLQDVFLAFYNLIYGASTIPVFEGVFPSNGRIETEFVIPGIGVEEVNIIVYGSTNRIQVFDADDRAAAPLINNYESFSTIKIKDFDPGVWKLVLEGNPGNNVKVNMVYNAELMVDVSLDSDGDVIEPDSKVTFSAVLKTKDLVASKPEHYAGYDAVLNVYDAYDELIDTVPMAINYNCFEAEYQFAEGAYRYSVAVECPYASAISEIEGPVVVQTKEVPIVNTSPVPVNPSVEKKVYLIPFKTNTLDIAMDNLAKDAEDETLHYKIVSSAFVEGTDYTVNDNVISMTNYSLKKGSFTIRATDSGGLSCDIEVLVKTISVSMIALIALGVVGLAILGAIVYAIAHAPVFKGTISADNLNNSFGAKTHGSFKGKIKLQYFGVGNCGFDQTKSVFVSKSKTQVAFKSNKLIYTDTSLEGKKEVTLFSGDNNIYSDAEHTQGIRVTVDAQIF